MKHQTAATRADRSTHCIEEIREGPLLPQPRQACSHASDGTKGPVAVEEHSHFQGNGSSRSPGQANTRWTIHSSLVCACIVDPDDKSAELQFPSSIEQG